MTSQLSALAGGLSLKKQSHTTLSDRNKRAPTRTIEAELKSLILKVPSILLN